MSLTDGDNQDVSVREKLEALAEVVRFRPRFAVAILLTGLLAAVLEGIGLGFILPVIETVRSSDPAAQADGLLSLFVAVYDFLGVPFTLVTVIGGVVAVMIVRYTMSFLSAWSRQALRTYYIRELQITAFENALRARIQYFDEEGSDDILNAIITQTLYAGRVIEKGTLLLEQAFLAGIYLLVALVIAPTLTAGALVVLGGLTVALRWGFDPGFRLGSAVAEANERRQEAAQAGTQGIRDVRLFTLTNELYDEFTDAVDSFTEAQIDLRRNEAAIDKIYKLSVSVSVFVLVFLALEFADLSLGSLGVFLFAMFRLGPRVSNVNRIFYQVENNLPHLIRTQKFKRQLAATREPDQGSREVPTEISTVEFDDVQFAYDERPVLSGINFELNRGGFIGIVGPSGAGKSTIVSLLVRLYEPDGGEIRVNGTPVDQLSLEEWRQQVAVVQQDPFIFNDTLRYNLTLADRDASEERLDQVCEIACVDEFAESLDDGYDTVLGDDGVQLSGGQRQRVALARALLKNAELLVLDEATSDLDSRLEQRVQSGIESMEQEYTVVTIAHRLSTVENADQIYTIEDGVVVEQGKHVELLQRGGTYSELYEIQT